MISDVLREALKEFGIGATGILSIANTSWLGFLHLTTVRKSECQTIHASTEKKFEEIKDLINGNQIKNEREFGEINASLKGINENINRLYEKR